MYIYPQMAEVKAKKHLGQHFLTDKGIAQRIADALQCAVDYESIIEVGPGMGILSQCLYNTYTNRIFLLDVDAESVQYLHKEYPKYTADILLQDFLKLELETLTNGSFAVIGNYPYNISSQIVFKVLDNRDKIPLMAGMFQKEVAQRIAAPHGNKEYGIISVLVQAYYDVDYLFTVKAGSFNPPPKVLSGVVRLVRKKDYVLPCSEKLFWNVVKTGFNQRRKTLRNAIKSLLPLGFEHEWLNLRAEALSVQQFISLTQLLEECSNKH